MQRTTVDDTLRDSIIALVRRDGKAKESHLIYGVDMEQIVVLGSSRSNA